MSDADYILVSDLVGETSPTPPPPTATGNSASGINSGISYSLHQSSPWAISNDMLFSASRLTSLLNDIPEEPQVHNTKMLQDFFSLSQDFFGKLPVSDLKAYRSAADYIQELCQNFGHDISHWDIKEVFKPREGERFIITTDRSEIRSRFTTKWETEKDVVLPAKCLKIEDSIKKHILEIQNSVRGMNKSTIEAQIESHIQNAIYNRQMMENDFIRAAEKRKVLDSVKDKTIDIAQTIDLILQQVHFLNFKSMTDRLITFSIKNPIILTERNKSAGIDISVNLGFFDLQIIPYKNLIRAIPVGDNVIIGSHPHPHTTNSGEVCLGSAHQTVVDAMVEFNYVKAILYTSSVLQNYNPGNPYVRLTSYLTERQKMDLRKHAETNNKVYKYGKLSNGVFTFAHNWAEKILEDQGELTDCIFEIGDGYYAIDDDDKLTCYVFNEAIEDEDGNEIDEEYQEVVTTEARVNAIIDYICSELDEPQHTEYDQEVMAKFLRLHDFPSIFQSFQTFFNDGYVGVFFWHNNDVVTGRASNRITISYNGQGSDPIAQVDRDRIVQYVNQYWTDEMEMPRRLRIGHNWMEIEF